MSTEKALEWSYEEYQGLGHGVQRGDKTSLLGVRTCTIAIFWPEMEFYIILIELLV